MPDEILHFGFVIEGQGEVAAFPLLIRRICNELLGFYALQTTRPVKVTKSRLLRDGELERAVQLATLQNDGRGPILVLLDADEDCPAQLGPSLKSRVFRLAEHHGVAIVIPKYEFETWFLTAAESLGGKRGLREGLAPPPHPETIRGAKEWLSRNMAPGQTYSPSIDQAPLVALMDLNVANSCKSFARLCRVLAHLVGLDE
jgi:hypothetical protein